MNSSEIKVIKKDGTEENFNVQKVVVVVNKSVDWAMIAFSQTEINFICEFVEEKVKEMESKRIPIVRVHNLVEGAPEKVNPWVAKSYRDHRNYKQDSIQMLDDVYKKSQSIMYIGDKKNSNTDSVLVSTKRSLIFNELNKFLYRKFFMTVEGLQVCREGYIYIHDMSVRHGTVNCCLLDVKEVPSGSFKMGNLWCNEPETLDVAFNVIGDIVLSAASQQYGGFIVPNVGEILAPYVEKSYEKYIQKYTDLGPTEEKTTEVVWKDVQRDMKQGFQGWEYKFNSVSSSRGDYPFITMTVGIGTSRFAKMATITALNMRKKGQGKKKHKKPVPFPKLVFLCDEKPCDSGGELEDVFEARIECSSKTTYPDWLSLTGKGYIASTYKQYGKIISPMGCRASLSLYYEWGSMYPADDKDVSVFVGRFNIGAVSLHLPMILAKARQKSRDFYEVPDYYLNLIRKIHIRTYAYFGEIRAITNPLAYCEGGFYGGHLKPNQKIKSLPKPAIASFGIMALNELQELYNGKSLVEDGQFALEVLEHINKEINKFKEKDGNLYAIYRMPAESLCGLQVKQFRNKYGIVENVSDRWYVNNSLYCHITGDITPIQKQNLEYRFWEPCNGGEIQYAKYPINYNLEAIKTLVCRAMDTGPYEGVSLSLVYCDDCGHQELEMDVCPVCGSENLTKIERMNGYLSCSRVKGDIRLNDARMAEIVKRKPMQARVIRARK